LEALTPQQLRKLGNLPARIPRQKIIYVYICRYGVFSIFENVQQRWELWLEDTCYGFYGSARLAADDVYTKHTGAILWDRSSDAGPKDLSEWERLFKG
jgi:hypothetical protein